MRIQFQRAGVLSVVFVLPLMSACHQPWSGQRDPLCRPWPGYVTVPCRTPPPCAPACQQFQPMQACPPCQEPMPVCPPCQSPVPVCEPICVRPNENAIETRTGLLKEQGQEPKSAAR